MAAEQAVSTTVQAGALAGYGLAQKTMPLTATFNRVASEGFLPRSLHSLVVIGERAYIFGGESAPGELAGNEVHIITLPSSSVRESDYQCVPSLGEHEEEKDVPCARAEHSGLAIGHWIYVFGGRDAAGSPIEENGRVWVFDTRSLRWTFLDPSMDVHPPARFCHAAVANEHPLPNTADPKPTTYTEQFKATVGKLPDLIGKASPPTEPYGTLIYSGGLSTSPDPLNDVWAFTIASQTWSKFPSPPSLFAPTHSLAFAHNRLYVISGSSNMASEIHWLQLVKETYNDRRGQGEMGISAKGDWCTLEFPTNPLRPGPRPRTGAGLAQITTGNGREYLLYFLGEKDATTGAADKKADESKDRTFWSDVWSYQTPPQGMTAASIKDATRQAMGIDTGEDVWCEVKVEASVEESEIEGKAHPGPRGWFASSALGKDVDGGGVILWGGINGKGEIEGDGWIIHVK